MHGPSRLAKKIEGCFNILFSYLACNHIWLNLRMDDHHFGDITKFTQNKTIGPKVLIQDPTLPISFSFIYFFVYLLTGFLGTCCHIVNSTPGSTLILNPLLLLPRNGPIRGPFKHTHTKYMFQLNVFHTTLVPGSL
jgi:hypothetical protein